MPTGIILAGGKSSRMGSDKGLLKLLNKSLVEHAIDILNPCCEDIIISSNNKEYEKFGFPVIGDIYKEKGPMGGIHAALNATATKKNLILSCDMPFITKELLSFLIEKQEDSIAVIPVHKDRPEPLCGIYSTKILPYIEQSISNKELKLMDLLNFVSALFPIVDSEDFYKPDLFNNINSKTDLGRARELLSS